MSSKFKPFENKNKKQIVGAKIKQIKFSNKNFKLGFIFINKKMNKII